MLVWNRYLFSVGHPDLDSDLIKVVRSLPYDAVHVRVRPHREVGMHNETAVFLRLALQHAAIRHCLHSIQTSCFPSAGTHASHCNAGTGVVTRSQCHRHEGRLSKRDCEWTTAATGNRQQLVAAAAARPLPGYRQPTNRCSFCTDRWLNAVHSERNDLL